MLPAVISRTLRLWIKSPQLVTTMLESLTWRASAGEERTTMPKGPNGQQRPADVIGNAVHIARIATGEEQETSLKQPAKRASGKAGAKARADTLTPEERSKIAKLAAEKRWSR